MPGWHYPGYRYLGPYTPVDDEYRRKNPPINWLDELAREHDEWYAEIARTAQNADQARDMEREADRAFLFKVRMDVKGFNVSVPEKIAASTAIYIMEAKLKAGYSMMAGGFDESEVWKEAVDMNMGKVPVPQRKRRINEYFSRARRVRAGYNEELKEPPLEDLFPSEQEQKEEGMDVEPLASGENDVDDEVVRYYFWDGYRPKIVRYDRFPIEYMISKVY